MSDTNLTMRPREYAERTKIGINRIYQLIKIDGFPVLKLGRFRLIMVEAADKWLADRAAQGKPL